VTAALETVRASEAIATVNRIANLLLAGPNSPGADLARHSKRPGSDWASAQTKATPPDNVPILRLTRRATHGSLPPCEISSVAHFHDRGHGRWNAFISSFSSRHDCSRRANLLRILFDKLTDAPVFRKDPPSRGMARTPLHTQGDSRRSVASIFAVRIIQFQWTERRLQDARVGHGSRSCEVLSSLACRTLVLAAARNLQ